MDKKYLLLLQEITREFPKFQIIEKENSSWMRFLFTITMMRFWNPEFMSRYVTVMFGCVYMPKSYIGTSVGYEILRHERIHLRDAKNWPIFFELSYLFFPLPIIFTMRAFWEYRAYCESLLTEYERLGYVNHSSIEFYVSQFTGSFYLWMCPFPNFMRKCFYNFLLKREIPVR